MKLRLASPGMLAVLVAACAVRSLPQTAAPPEVHATPSSGAQIAYQIFGDGPPLLIINGGFGSDSRGFEGLASLLATRHRVILFDRRGTGRSTLPEPGTGNLTMDLMVADIEAIRRALDLEGWSVLGHSFGGMLASHYVATHPERVQSLVLSSSSGVDMHLFSMGARAFVQQRLGEADRAELARLEAAYEAGDASDTLLKRFSVVLARAYVYDDSHSDWVVRRLRGSDQEVARLVTQDLERIAFDAKPALSGFDRPVLILQGRQDVLPVSISQRARAAFPNARLVVLEECGHYGWLDQETAYVSTVLDFLAE